LNFELGGSERVKSSGNERLKSSGSEHLSWHGTKGLGGIYKMTIGSKFMRMSLMAAVAILFVSGVAQAQGDAGAAPRPEPGRMGPGPKPFDEFGFVGFEAGIGGKTVTGAPFSATFSTQSTQTLADGNQIQRNSTGTFARDTQGRTRREMTLPAIGRLAAAGNTPPHAVFISDPVGGVNYILHADEKTADQLPMRARKGGRNFEAMPDIKRRFLNEETTTDLGTQNINGVTAQGTRITRTIPAGAIGNVKAIVVVTERWYSSELQTYVMTKKTDPVMGDTVTQLTNIQRQEPDASLFRVPADYAVSQGGGPRGGGRLRGATPAPPEVQ
jgi:hypothetical protein